MRIPGIDGPGILYAMSPSAEALIVERDGIYSVHGWLGGRVNVLEGGKDQADRDICYNSLYMVELPFDDLDDLEELAERKVMEFCGPPPPPEHFGPDIVVD